MTRSGRPGGSADIDPLTPPVRRGGRGAPELLVAQQLGEEAHVGLGGGDRPVTEQLLHDVDGHPGLGQPAADGVAHPRADRAGQLPGLPSLEAVGGETPQQAAGAWVSTGIFDVLGIGPASGRRFEPADMEPGAAPVIILGGILTGVFTATEAGTVAAAPLVRELARRTGLQSYSFHPGYVATGFGADSAFIKLSYLMRSGGFGVPVEQGAEMHHGQDPAGRLRRDPALPPPAAGDRRGPRLP